MMCKVYLSHSGLLLPPFSPLFFSLPYYGRNPGDVSESKFGAKCSPRSLVFDMHGLSASHSLDLASKYILFLYFFQCLSELSINSFIELFIVLFKNRLSSQYNF